MCTGYYYYYHCSVDIVSLTSLVQKQQHHKQTPLLFFRSLPSSTLSTASSTIQQEGWLRKIHLVHFVLNFCVHFPFSSILYHCTFSWFSLTFMKSCGVYSGRPVCHNGLIQKNATLNYTDNRTFYLKLFVQCPSRERSFFNSFFPIRVHKFVSATYTQSVLGRKKQQN